MFLLTSSPWIATARTESPPIARKLASGSIALVSTSSTSAQISRTRSAVTLRSGGATSTSGGTSGNTALLGANLLYELLCSLPGVALRN